MNAVREEGFSKDPKELGDVDRYLPQMRFLNLPRVDLEGGS